MKRNGGFAEQRRSVMKYPEIVEKLTLEQKACFSYY